MLGLVVSKGASMVEMSMFFHFNCASHSGSNHSTHVGLSPSIAGTSQLLHCDPGHSPIQHSSAKLNGDPQTIMGGLQDEHWDVFIITLYWRNPYSSFYIPQVWNGEPPILSKCIICFNGCISYPCSSQKSHVMVETCALVSMRAFTQMSSTKISASFTIPAKSTAASGC